MSDDEPHIVETEGVLGGKPRLDGHRIGVHHIWARYTASDVSALQLSEEVYPHLSLAQVDAALDYAREHRAEIEGIIRDQQEFVPSPESGDRWGLPELDEEGTIVGVSTYADELTDEAAIAARLWRRARGCDDPRRAAAFREAARYLAFLQQRRERD